VEEQLGDVLVAELQERLRLLREPAPHVVVGEVLVVERLERAPPPLLDVPRQVHGGGPPVTEEVCHDEAAAAEARGWTPFQLETHRGRPYTNQLPVGSTIGDFAFPSGGVGGSHL
jgi:hypothetical protein